MSKEFVNSMTIEQGSTITREKSDTFNYGLDIGVSLTIGAEWEAGGLFAKAKGSVSATASMNNKFDWSWTETESKETTNGKATEAS